MNSMHKDSIERRNKKRHRKSLDLHLHVHPGQKGGKAGSPIAVQTHDVCMNGLSCYLPTPLNLFTKYRFRLFVPGLDARMHEIDGEGIVVRVEEVEVEETDVFQTALFFQHLDAGHLRILETFLSEESLGREQ